MNTNGYSRIPRELFYWITFLTKSLPLRSVGTFLELLIGAMLTQQGFVTEAYNVITMQNHWTSYYKWLSRGRWSWLNLSRQFFILILQTFVPDVVRLVIDDTIILRSSKKAPGSEIHHQHGNKPNLSNFVRGQCWVSLAFIMRRSALINVAIPLLSRLMPSVGNTGKLVAANTLIRALKGLLTDRKVRILVDSWYMRRVFIDAMLKFGFHVIGQVRKDTRLYEQPAPRVKGQRGRPKKYGEQITSERRDLLEAIITTLVLYGKKQKVRYRTCLAKARFLNGRLVRVVWCELEKDDGSWTQASLILSTDTTLTAEEIIEEYGMRWAIEPMFNQLKLAWGLKEAWQQTRQCLHRWVHITSIAYGLLQMLSCLSNEAVTDLCQQSPWRVENVVTPGQIRKGLRRILMHVDVRSWWDATCEKFSPPNRQKIENTG